VTQQLNAIPRIKLNGKSWVVLSEDYNHTDDTLTLTLQEETTFRDTLTTTTPPETPRPRLAPTWWAYTIFAIAAIMLGCIDFLISEVR
jgi:hypothetical protein